MSEKTCPNCGFFSNGDATFCPKCGKKLERKNENRMLLKDCRIGVWAFLVLVILLFAVIVFVVISSIISNNNRNNVQEVEEKVLESEELIEEVAKENNESFIGESSSNAIIPEHIQVGDRITFGRYEQDNIFSNGKEKLEWEVIALSSGKAMIITRYIIDSCRYSDVRESVTWEESLLRKWLNGEFYNNSFSEDEKAYILDSNVINSNGLYGDVVRENDTVDKVFCLSFAEAKEYYKFTYWDPDGEYGYSQALLGIATPYAKTKKLWSYTVLQDDSEWLEEVGYSQDLIGETRYARWLRDPGGKEGTACVVFGGGSLGKEHVCYVDDVRVGITPVLWISVDD